ncbi:MAG: ABC transporter substrate-binding protein [Turicibacter sp.]|nr:ABC transporter substrate-binding protein [Turicibacter sp.]
MKVRVFFLVVMLIFAACGGNEESGGLVAGNGRPSVDREGFAIELPDEINSIISIGPSNTEVLVALGFGDRIVAVDMFSADVDGLAGSVSMELSMMALDAEYVVSLMPDVVFVTGMARAGGEDDPLAPVSAAGISVVYMPTSASIAEIMEDIRFVAAVMEDAAAGEVLIANMQAEIDEISQIAQSVTETRTVYFEISPAPWMFSTGTGTFLHEMIELVGAVNVFAGEEGWIPVSDEAVLAADPDVILTSSDFIDDPVGEILERPGFDVITAVQNGNVFEIDANASSRPSHNITIALWQIARAIFPEYF